MRSDHQAGPFALQPLADTRDFLGRRLLLRNQVVETEHHQRVGVLQDAFVDRELVSCLVNPLKYRGRMAGDLGNDLLKGERGAVEQLQRACNSLQEVHPVPLRRLIIGPGNPADLGHGRKAIIHFGQIPIGFPWVAPGPVDAEAALTSGVRARHVVLVVRASDANVRHKMFSSIQTLPPTARYCSALMPGRKKYAPPLTVVKAGNPVIFLRIGRFGILNSSVPS